LGGFGGLTRFWGGVEIECQGRTKGPDDWCNGDISTLLSPLASLDVRARGRMLGDCDSCRAFVYEIPLELRNCGLAGLRWVFVRTD
jgi:hypothetical protein